MEVTLGHPHGREGGNKITQSFPARPEGSLALPREASVSPGWDSLCVGDSGGGDSLPPAPSPVAVCRNEFSYICLMSSSLLLKSLQCLHVHAAKVACML